MKKAIAIVLMSLFTGCKTGGDHGGWFSVDPPEYTAQVIACRDRVQNWYGVNLSDNKVSVGVRLGAPTGYGTLGWIRNPDGGMCGAYTLNSTKVVIGVTRIGAPLFDPALEHEWWHIAYREKTGKYGLPAEHQNKIWGYHQ